MATVAERLDVEPLQLWTGSVLALLVALIGGSLLFPRTVYDGFVWHFFWGPVQADANSAFCAIREGGATRYLYESAACSAAPEPVAYPGYTLVSEVGYVVILLVALSGLVFLLRALDLGTDRELFFSLLPFVFFGGALRVVEDVTDAAADPLIDYPLNTLLISPVIYFTVFGVTLAAVVASVALARRNVVDDYTRPLLASGVVFLVATLLFLLWSAVAPDGPGTFYPQVIVVILAGSTVSAAGTWWLIERFAPAVNAGTGRMGFVVIWGHAVDGVANVVGLDWMVALGAGPNLVPKHPVNRAIVEITGSTLPASVLAVTGDTWPFLVVKLVAATVVVWLFDAQIFDENPRYAILLMIAILAVGLGPGTRDMLRATFGV
ncbi:DUF63 family protein [Haloplanus rubicundus]|uniref:DUF63 family protein n=1 Tax=Haloplanus rubicundus TaxID=1547898 RepID=A0A345E6J2_9EURY|nr:DUF63 family protein [Haloplanus rubicundus]AXG07814.1 DUF63 family protein [Haloplanus rubicundus]